MQRGDEGMYDNFKLCPDLKPGNLCFVVEQYRDGIFEKQFHSHIANSRLSKDAIINLLMVLVARFDGGTGMGADHIISCYLNKRGKTPASSNSLLITTNVF